MLILEACLLNKSSCLAPALGVTKFTNAKDTILVTLGCDTYVGLCYSKNLPFIFGHWLLNSSFKCDQIYKCQKYFLVTLSNDTQVELSCSTNLSLIFGHLPQTKTFAKMSFRTKVCAPKRNSFGDKGVPEVVIDMFWKRLAKIVAKPGKSYWRGGLSTVDLLINVGCFVKQENKVSEWKGVDCKLVRTRRSTVLSLPLQWEFPG